MTHTPENPTDLDKRMALHTPGQITWPEPALGKWCSQCRHFTNDGTRDKTKGRCNLVAAHSNHKTKGVLFVGQEATACPQFDGGGA